MKIVVVGTGYVGLVAGVCFAEIGHDVICVDIDQTKIDMINSGKSPIYERDLEGLLIKNRKAGRISATADYKGVYREAEVIFIGVGTPERVDGSADLSYLAEVLIQIAECAERDCLVVIKSTVPVGTNKKAEQLLNDFKVNDVHLEVASNPEFLAQGSAVRDTIQASRIVLGTESKGAEETLRKIYEPYHLPILVVSRESAEMIKYASNCFLALKISYMNDIANLCELVGADVEDVARGMSYDKRIGERFLNAGIGYGGSCLPKDTKALVHIAKEYGYPLSTVEVATRINEEQRRKLTDMAKKRFVTLKNKKIAILGLAFKPGTDDLRYAPSLDNIALLLELGADLHVYDPIATKNLQKLYPREVTYTLTPQEALKEANVCFIFTEWKEIKEITPETYKQLMKHPIVYDGRNIYKKDSMQQAGIEYYSIGR